MRHAIEVTKTQNMTTRIVSSTWSTNYLLTVVMRQLLRRTVANSANLRRKRCECRRNSHLKKSGRLKSWRWRSDAAQSKFIKLSSCTAWTMWRWTYSALRKRLRRHLKIRKITSPSSACTWRLSLTMLTTDAVRRLSSRTYSLKYKGLQRSRRKRKDSELILFDLTKAAGHVLY